MNNIEDEKSRRNEAMGQLLAELLDGEDFTIGQQRRNINLSELIKAFWFYRKLYYKVLGITTVLVVVVMLSIKNYYRCEVLLAPEISSGMKSNSGLASLASSFGINLNNASSQMDAILPTLYPDLMNSVAFRSSLFPVKVQCLVGDSIRTEMTYYDYLKNEQNLPWWTAVSKASIKWITSFFKDKEEQNGFDPFQLTEEQFEVVKLMEKKVSCEVDNSTMVISISVIDQDAYIAATMADSVQRRLQDFITEYRTRKARVDVDHYRILFAEAKQDYETALAKNAAYTDANQRVFLQKVRSQETKLQNEVSLQYQTYSQVAAQLKLAEAKVQEVTPAFTTLQPATVPVKKAGPKRILICLISLFLASICTSAYVLYVERDHIISK